MKITVQHDPREWLRKAFQVSGDQDLFGKIWRILTQQGPLTLVRLAYRRIVWLHQMWSDASIDRRFGVDTCGKQRDLGALGVTGENIAHGRSYEPIQIPVFNRIVKKLPIQVRDYCFIDYGSGKARALILAAEAGFGRVIGVEFAPVLHAAAQSNIARYQRHRPGRAKFEIYCQDATTFSLPECNSVLFLNNPFDDVLMSKVLADIESSWNRRPRDIIIAYRNAVHASVFDTARFMQLLSEDPAFRLYRTRNPQ